MGGEPVQTKVVQTATKAEPKQTGLSNYIPDTAWIIVAVGIVGLLLMIGVRILRSKTLRIDTPKVDIECDDGTKITVSSNNKEA